MQLRAGQRLAELDQAARNCMYFPATSEPETALPLRYERQNAEGGATPPGMQDIQLDFSTQTNVEVSRQANDLQEGAHGLSKNSLSNLSTSFTSSISRSISFLPSRRTRTLLGRSRPPTSL